MNIHLGVFFANEIKNYEKVYNIKQLLGMEEVLIYDIESQNNENYSQHDNEDFEPSKASSKETQIQQVLVAKTIKVRSISSQQSPKRPQIFKQHLKEAEQREENIIFYEQDLRKTHSSIDVDETNRGFLKRKVQTESEDSDEYQDEVQELQKLNQKYDQQYLSQQKKKIIPTQTTQKNKTVLVTANVSLLIKQIVPKGYKLTCYLQVIKGILGFGGIYRLFLGQQRQFLMSAKKEVLKYYSNFLISRHHRQIHKRSDIYLGRLESNFIGTQFKLFSVKDGFETMKLLMNYKKNIVGLNGLRTLRAVKLDPQIKKQQFFSTLSNILQRNEHSKLIQFSTAEPILKNGRYRLDFKGKVKIPSPKNFILLNNKGQQSLLFGKTSENEYIVQVSYPLTIFEAFGICLSSLDSKLMVN